MKIAYQVQIGQDKIACEDHALVCNESNYHILNNTKGEIESSLPCIIAVADGVGGNPGGHEASNFSVNEATQLFKIFKEQEVTEKELSQAMKNINSKLVEYANTVEGKERMATTFSLIYLDNDKGFFTHTGNTRVCVLNNIFVKQLTTDHTTYQWLLDTGNHEAAENCNKCEINSCLGGGSEKNLTRLDTKLFYDENNIPNLILMTSDGIHEYVDLDFLEDTINDNSISDLEKTEKIVQESLKNGSEDDKTILIIRK